MRRGAFVGWTFGQDPAAALGPVARHEGGRALLAIRTAAAQVVHNWLTDMRKA